MHSTTARIRQPQTPYHDGFSLSRQPVPLSGRGVPRRELICATGEVARALWQSPLGGGANGDEMTEVFGVCRVVLVLVVSGCFRILEIVKMWLCAVGYS